MDGFITTIALIGCPLKWVWYKTLGARRLGYDVEIKRAFYCGLVTCGLLFLMLLSCLF